jgi:hypothetical protein
VRADDQDGVDAVAGHGVDSIVKRGAVGDRDHAGGHDVARLERQRLGIEEHVGRIGTGERRHIGTSY